MSRRGLGVALALLVVGVAAGFVGGNTLSPEPASIATASPVPAQSPSYPVNQYVVLPDPGIAPLATDLPSHEEAFRLNALRLATSVPDGWLRVPLTGGAAWNFAPPNTPPNSYILRIEIVATSRASVPAAMGSRILRLQNAVDDGNMRRLVIENETDDGFVASYLDPSRLPTGGFFQRVTMERWLTFGGGSTAYADIAVTGREADRAGLADLLARVVASATIPRPEPSRG